MLGGAARPARRSAPRGRPPGAPYGAWLPPRDAIPPSRSSLLAADGPVWDGTGTDPWLPHRLDQQLHIARAERSVWDDYLARLSAWLVRVARAVFAAGGIIDPNGVWSQAPRWAQEMADFTNTTIKGLMRQAYDALLGEEFDFDSRPYTYAYLAQVTNRLVNTPDEVFDLITGEVAEGAGQGESIPKIAERVERVLSTTDTPHWPNRATVVARTETLGALNAGRYDASIAMAQALDELEDEEEAEAWESVWLATADTRTRKTHREADGQRVPLGTPFTVGGFELLHPGVAGAPAREVVQCRCTTLLVRHGEVLDWSNRQFKGD